MKFAASSVAVAIVVMSAVDAAEKPATQMAYFLSDANKCETADDMFLFVRFSGPKDLCLQNLTKLFRDNEDNNRPLRNQTGVGEMADDNAGIGRNSTTSSTCFQMNNLTTTISCIDDIGVMPNNTKGNAYVVQEIFDSENCQGTMLGLNGLQTNLVSNATTPVNPADPTLSTGDLSSDKLMSAACTPGDEIELKQCLTPDNCTTYSTLKDGGCLEQENNNGTAAQGSIRVLSVRYRCIPNGGLLNSTLQIKDNDPTGGSVQNQAFSSSAIALFVTLIMIVVF